MSETSPALEFSGERFTPECVREIWQEHWHRYAFAYGLANGKRVLDAACGEGYGSDLLARVADTVVGMDISSEAIQHAASRYRRPNLQFERGDVTALKRARGEFDLIVSFETLEHVEAQSALIEGFTYALNDTGLLLISSPDKHTYSEVLGTRNEFHVRELYRDELLALLAPHFPHVRLFGQKLLFQSVLWALEDPGSTGLDEQASQRAKRSHEAWTSVADAVMPIEPGLLYAPVYYVAVCSHRPLPATLPILSLFGDRQESVYAHYNHEIRKNMSAGARIAELEAEVERLRSGRS
ncbi:MAG: methyltransferase domain-containing protein [Dokdonella sp.]